MKVRSNSERLCRDLGGILKEKRAGKTGHTMSQFFFAPARVLSETTVLSFQNFMPSVYSFIPCQRPNAFRPPPKLFIHRPPNHVIYFLAFPTTRKLSLLDTSSQSDLPLGEHCELSHSRVVWRASCLS